MSNLKKSKVSEITISNPIYSVGDIVYYAIPENSEPGIITDSTFSLREKRWKYHVSFDPYNDAVCIEEELSETKRIV